jgi:hypothetical protein
MAVNQIQFAQRSTPKKDVMDTILQGLQVAEAVFKIPAGYEQFRSYRAKAGMDEDERAGVTTEEKIAKTGGYFVPGSQLLPEQEQQYGRSLMPTKIRRGDEVVEGFAGNRESERKFFDAEKGLRSEYEGHQITKATNEVITAGDKAMAALTRPGAKFGPDDLAAIIGFSKAADPIGSVKEGEIDNVRGTQSALSQLHSAISGLSSGVKLDDPARKNLARTLGILMHAQAQIQGRIDDQYRGMAKEQGFKEGNVVTGFWNDEKHKNLRNAFHQAASKRPSSSAQEEMRKRGILK